MKIAIQGYKYSFHEIAAKKFFNQDIELIMCDSFRKLFQVMKNRQAAYAIMAIENSVAGTILPNYTMLQNSNLTIVGELYLRIKMNLIGFHGQKIEDINDVYSHPMAILQCDHFFNQHPHLRLVEAEDTAKSVSYIKEHGLTAAAAIASKHAALENDMEVLAAEIETNRRNYTRFFVLQDRDFATLDYQHTNKASVSFLLKHQVGTLALVLTILAENGINLTKIQSLPVVGREWQYSFILNLNYTNHRKYVDTLKKLSPYIEDLKQLGVFKQGEKYYDY